jgi:hypothetical protein
MSDVNSEEMQKMYRLLVSQLIIRPDNVLANLNAMLQGENINLEVKMLRADVCSCHNKEAVPAFMSPHLYMLPPHHAEFGEETLF